MEYTNNLAARQGYENAKKVFLKAWTPDYVAKYGASGAARAQALVDSYKLTQSEIRLEVALTTTGTVFTFGVTANQQSTGASVIFPSENRLNLQDQLCVSEYGVFVGKAASPTDSNFQLNTYGNINVFATGAANLNQEFYGSGNVNMKVNNDVIIPYRGLFAHWYIPQTQQLAAAANTVAASQIRGAEDGFVTMEPNFILSGSANNIPQIQLRAALAAVDANTRAVLIFRGHLAQNSTVVN